MVALRVLAARQTQSYEEPRVQFTTSHSGSGVDLEEWWLNPASGSFRHLKRRKDLRRKGVRKCRAQIGQSQKCTLRAAGWPTESLTSHRSPEHHKRRDNGRVGRGHPGRHLAAWQCAGWGMAPRWSRVRGQEGGRAEAGTKD
jgi:hypothetical protein